jgi:uncharacterized DUF497 family protein
VEEQAFDWDDANREHVGRHDVTAPEVEEVILDPEAVMIEEQNTDGEDRFKLVGRTAGGRILVAVFTLRSNLIRPITAYSASQRDAESYLKGYLI